jgi:SAM-dependent methyltransferase
VRDTSFRQRKTSRLDDLIFRVRARTALKTLPSRCGAVADLRSGYDARFLRLVVGRRLASSGIALDVAVDGSQSDDAVTPIEGDLPQPPPIPDASVDVVTSLAVLEHLNWPTVRVSEVFKILRPGGVLILTPPSTRSRPVLDVMTYRLPVIDEIEIRDHKHYFTRADLVELLANVGFDRRSISYRSFSMGANHIVVAANAKVAG